MKKLIVIIIIVLLVVVAGCSQEEEPQQILEADYTPPVFSNWLTPGKVEIDNYYNGATAEYPLTFHNGSDGIYAERILVTTDPLETTADIPVAFNLAFPDLLDDVKITSNREELLSTTRIRNNMVTITGFEPNCSRELTIEYIRKTPILVYFKIPTRTQAGFVAATDKQQSWVTFPEEYIEFFPLETKDILVVLHAPSDARLLSDKWEFWVGVSEDTSRAQALIRTELASKWLVSMR